MLRKQTYLHIYPQQGHAWSTAIVRHVRTLAANGSREGSNGLLVVNPWTGWWLIIYLSHYRCIRIIANQLKHRVSSIRANNWIQAKEAAASIETLCPESPFELAGSINGDMEWDRAVWAARALNRDNYARNRDSKLQKDWYALRLLDISRISFEYTINTTVSGSRLWIALTIAVTPFLLLTVASVAHLHKWRARPYRWDWRPIPWLTSDILFELASGKLLRNTRYLFTASAISTWSPSPSVQGTLLMPQENLGRSSTEVESDRDPGPITSKRWKNSGESSDA